jgi:hypothetical protein
VPVFFVVIRMIFKGKRPVADAPVIETASLETKQ